MNVFFGFRQIEAEGNRAIRRETVVIMHGVVAHRVVVHGGWNGSLHGEAIFVQVEQFAQVEYGARTRRIEADIDRRMKALTNSAASLTVRKARARIRQSEAPIHGCTILTQTSTGGENDRESRIQRGSDVGGVGSNFGLLGGEENIGDGAGALEGVGQGYRKMRGEQVDV